MNRLSLRHVPECAAGACLCAPTHVFRVTLSSRSIAIDRSQCCRAGCAVDGPRRQDGGRSALEDDSLLLERVGQLSRLGQVGGRHIELQQLDALFARALLQRFVGQQAS